MAQTPQQIKLDEIVGASIFLQTAIQSFVNDLAKEVGDLADIPKEAGGTMPVKTGALRASKLVREIPSGSSISYTVPYAEIIHDGGVVGDPPRTYKAQPYLGKPAEKIMDTMHERIAKDFNEQGLGQGFRVQVIRAASDIRDIYDA
jgi:hypothetical protein